MEHLTAEIVLAFTYGELEAAELGPHLVHHALEVCPVCRQAVLEAQRTVGKKLRRDLVEHLLTMSTWMDPDRIRAKAEEEAAILLSLTPDERRRRMDGDEVRFSSPALVHLLLKEAKAAIQDDPARAVELAQLGFDVACRIDPEIVGDLAYEMQALAAAHKGNALRVNDQPRLAGSSFRFARRHLALAASPDRLVQAELLSLEASLSIDQRHFDEAEAMLRTADRLLFDLGAGTERARLLILYSTLLSYRGSYAAAARVCEQVLGIVDPSDHPRLHMIALFNLCHCHSMMGELLLARPIFERHRAEFLVHDELRTLWLEGRLGHLEGQHTRAAELLEKVRSRLLGLGRAYDAAQCSLDLAVVYLDEGRLSDVCRLASEMVEVFRSQEVEREAVAALLLFETAARRRELTVGLIQQLHRFLDHVRLDKSLTLQSFLDA